MHQDEKITKTCIETHRETFQNRLAKKCINSLIYNEMSSNTQEYTERLQHWASIISSVNANTDVEQSWRDYVQNQKEEDLKELIESENLKPEETEKFIESSFRDGQVRTTGTDIDKILPPMSRFGGGNRQEKKKTVIEKIQNFFERYFGL